MKCLEIARLQYFAPNTQGLLGALSGPQTPCLLNEPPSENFCLRACTAFRFSWNICEFTMQVKHVFHVGKTILQNYRYITNTCAYVKSPYYLTFSNCRESFVWPLTCVVNVPVIIAMHWCVGLKSAFYRGREETFMNVYEYLIFNLTVAWVIP